MTETVLALEDLSIDEGRLRIVDRVSFSIPRNGIFALLGRPGSGKTRLVQCALGLAKPAGGRAMLFGEDAAKRGKKLRARFAFLAGDSARGDAGSALESPIELLVLDEPAADDVSRGELFERVKRRAEGRFAVLLATADPAGVEGFADRVGILSKGRLAVDEDPASLSRRFRRITYRNEITETRTDYGTELDAFEAVRVRVRGWGVEAVVSNFDERVFDAFAAQDGVEGAIAEPMGLPEIFAALAGESPSVKAPR